MKIIRKIFKGAHDVKLLTLPKEVTETLKIKAGDNVVFCVEGGLVVLQKVEM